MSFAGVPGGGGIPGPPDNLAAGIAAVPVASGPFGVVGCKKDKIHTVTVELRYEDTREFVRAAKCRILKGTATINSGPLASGRLESRNLPAAAYSVTFPDIDADEWKEG